MLKLRSLITPSAVLAALTLAATPVVAQQKYHGREEGSAQPSGQPSGQQSGGQSRERAQPRSEAPRQQAEPRPQAETRQQAMPRPQAGAAPQAETRQQAMPRPQAGAAPQAETRQQAVPRAESRGNDNRANDNRRYDNRGNDNRRYEGHAVPRGNVYAPHYDPDYAPRYDLDYSPLYDLDYSPRYSQGYTPRGYGYYGSRSYYRPYVFRPRFSIGFGLYSGYPVPYTYSYPYPIEIYGYRAPRERVMITPGSPYYGGVALEMSPYDADVFVDGQYAGKVEDFDGAQQPLTLSTGQHDIEVQAAGYEPLRLTVYIQPGQVIPYRGDLRPF